MNEADMQVFIRGTSNYFDQLSVKAEVGMPYLKDQEVAMLDFSAAIGISGPRRGCVYYTAPQEMTSRLAADLGEIDTSDALCADMVGEIANIIAGNACEELGASFMISVPVILVGRSQQMRFREGVPTFLIPIYWRNYKSLLVHLPRRRYHPTLNRVSSDRNNMLSPIELNFFVEANCRFFDKVAPDQLVLKGASLDLSTPVFLDYTGLIEITGQHCGNVYLTMSREMVVTLTRAMGEEKASEETLRDAVGEIASIISSNAREHFGPLLGISVPRSLTGAESSRLALAPMRFVLPMGLRDEEAFSRHCTGGREQ